MLIQVSHSPTFISDLPRGARLIAACPRCRRSTVLNVKDLIQKYGLMLKLDAVRDRVRCHRCRERTRTIRVFYRTES
jgi:hypothetical protein